MTTAAPELIAAKRRPTTWYGIWAIVNTALGVLLAVLIGINLPLFRRLHLASGTAKAALTLLTAALLIVPSFLLW